MSSETNSIEAITELIPQAEDDPEIQKRILTIDSYLTKEELNPLLDSISKIINTIPDVDLYKTAVFREKIKKIIEKNPSLLTFDLTKKLIKDSRYHNMILRIVVDNSDMLTKNYPAISLLTSSHLNPMQKSYLSEEHPFDQNNFENLRTVVDILTSPNKEDAKIYITTHIKNAIEILQNKPEHSLEETQLLTKAKSIPEFSSIFKKSSDS